MAQSVQFPEPMESMVCCVKDTPPGDIIALTLQRLRAGSAPKELLAPAAVEEYASTREPYRWVPFVSAAQAVGCSYGRTQDVYSRARQILSI